MVESGADPAPLPARPQDPREPFPYDALDVELSNADAGLTLAGTLTLPATDGPHPAAALVSGSGRHERDQEVFGHRPFRVLADHLTRRGIAVLRYDDRGTAGSSGDFASATSADFATDAAAAAAWLAGHPAIDPDAVGLVGHSEGAGVAALAAARSGSVAFVVLLSGSGLPGREISVRQAAAMPPPGIDGSRYRDFIREALDIAASEGEAPGLEEELRRHYRAGMPILRAMTPPGTDMDAFLEAQVEASLSPWARFYYRFDPTEALRRVSVPVLGLHGRMDVQVPAGASQTAMRAALEEAGNPDVTLEELPGLNHLLQECGSGSVEEYGRIEQTLAPRVMERIAGWIRERTARAGP